MLVVYSLPVVPAAALPSLLTFRILSLPPEVLLLILHLVHRVFATPCLYVV